MVLTHALVTAQRGAKKAGIHDPVWNTITSRYPYGTNVFTRDWDVLILLDACRVDGLRHVAPEYDFIDTVGSITSVGSMSPEWIINTFTQQHREQIRDTGLLMSHAWYYNILGKRLHTFNSLQAAREGITSESVRIKGYYNFLYQGYPDWNVCHLDTFADVDHVWKLNRKLDEHDTYNHRPEIITDRAIDFGRSQAGNRLVVHYMLPHTPFDGPAYEENRQMEEWEKNPLGAARNGDVTHEQLLSAHESNIRFVLDHVEILLRNLDAETVIITADHGEALGEYGVYGHPWGSLHPNVKKVPWVVTEGHDSGEYESEYPQTPTSAIRDDDVESNLRALGYL